MAEKRLDLYCADKVRSRTKAQDLIKEGLVKVNGKVIKKPSFLVLDTDLVVIESKEDDYVSRAGYKLQAVFDHFDVNIENQVVLDIGASTGGFTDVCLRHGAKKVYALDVGHLQLDPSLDKDERVIKMEGKNARDIEPDWFDDPIQFVCMDVSFISCKTILEHILQTLKFEHIAFLIKPQFECGPQFLNKKGVLKNPKLEKRIVSDIENYIRSYFEKVNVIASPIKGRSGNQEYMMYASKRR